MFWFNKLAEKIDPGELQIINDSKTPSGRVHVGALRGVLIHDAVFRMLKERNVPVRYLFGVDDYDPLDELPSGQSEFFRPFLGVPLCNVPAPEGSPEPDMAAHYIREFFEIFHELGVQAETYQMRDIYREGRFNEAIDVILRHSDVVRRIYKEVGGADRVENWYPFQAICEVCGRVGTTEVTAYDGKEVEYHCRADLVKWAVGCGHRGRVSPFDGGGKLPWKLEWVAKWRQFPVTIEGAGKDHNTRGGSRDVTARCLREIFGRKPPLNIPYEFFLVGGAKMSSSKGIGTSARAMADFLPPEILRFLMLRTAPNRTVDFSVDEEFIVKLFNDFDRYHFRTFHDPKMKEEEKEVYRISEIEPEGDYFDSDFQLVLALVQMPHLDIVHEIEKRKEAPLTEIERKHLDSRCRAARYWLDHFADEEEKLRLQETLPERAHSLTDTQRAFLHRLAGALPSTPWKDEALQTRIFDIARTTPIDTPLAFQAIYRVLFDRVSGPRAGNLLAFLDGAFVVDRFKELPCSIEAYRRETAEPSDDIEAFLGREKERIRTLTGDLWFMSMDAASETAEDSPEPAMGGIDLTIVLHDSRTHVKRALLYRSDGPGSIEEREAFYDRAATYFQPFLDAASSPPTGLERATFAIAEPSCAQPAS